jgi:GNAT superfamily N-acetyltransferase
MLEHRTSSTSNRSAISRCAAMNRYRTPGSTYTLPATITLTFHSRRHQYDAQPELKRTPPTQNRQQLRSPVPLEIVSAVRHSCMTPEPFVAQETIEPDRLPQLLGLFSSAWWMADRAPDDVTQMLRESDLVLSLIHQPTDRLVGFTRVLTDYTYLAMVLDVVVSDDFRGSGLGAALMDAVIQHPRLTGVRSIELVCQPDLVPFYRRWGFTDAVGGSRLMRRTTDPRLTSAPT